MQRISPGQAWPLYDVATTRRIEEEAAAGLPAHTLMQRAGLAVARLALALAPHARTIWLACGPGNNGGDGLEAAMHLRLWGKNAVVTWLGREDRLPQDAAASLQRARAAGVSLADAPPASFDFAVDALLGIGAQRPLEGAAAQWRQLLAEAGQPVLAVDLPSGLNADTGMGQAVAATHTLSLLALKPGLFTGHGRDACGDIWFDDLGVTSSEPPSALLNSPAPSRPRPHASHKGSWGDVAVVGGAPGMRGATLLAATAALHAGAGRVYVAQLGADPMAVDASAPELMFRPVDALDLRGLHVVCGCGGGDAVRGVLPALLSNARSLVLDADALNAIAADASLQTLLRARAARADRPTVMTPHPLEAARLLGVGAGDVQSDRLGAARRLVERFGGVVVLKGSGTLIASAQFEPRVNATGNARLATAGTGDVLAGMVAANLAQGLDALDAACDAVWRHGALADAWGGSGALTAGGLARGVGGS
jgi:hydroxyethylthiazole kinase-like uncharacterized protein yjeF